MSESKVVHTRVFSEDRTRQILARAAELDRLFAGQLSESAIREAAEEAGISQAAIEQAIQEAGSTLPTLAGPLPSRPSLKRWVQNSMMFGIGGAVGVLARLIDPRPWGPLVGWGHLSQATVVAAVGLAVLSAALAFEGRDKESPARFQVKNVLLWSGWIVGWWLLMPLPSSTSLIEFSNLTLVGGLGGALLGGIAWLRGNLSKSPEARMTSRASALPT